MTDRAPTHGWAGSGWGTGERWQDAVDRATARMYETYGSPSPYRFATASPDRTHASAPPLEVAASPSARESGGMLDLVMVHVTAGFRDDFAAIIARVQQETGASVVVGCSAWSVISGGRELEEQEAVAILALRAPGITVKAIALSPEIIERAGSLSSEADRGAWWRSWSGVEAADVHAWIMLGEPYSVDGGRLVQQWNQAYPGVPTVGGMASMAGDARPTALFLDGRVINDGAIVIAIGGDWTIQTAVSQGCEPIGSPWTITAVEGDRSIRTIGRRPAISVLVETVRALPAEQVERARGNLFAGLAVDELRSTLGRGDFLVSNVVGADQATGAVLINATPMIGQTIQFQYRDRISATADLASLLRDVHAHWGDARPLAAFLWSCNGRGVGLFQEPDHDARALQEIAPSLPVVGFACFGEIGPVGGRSFLHSHTASIGFLVPIRTHR